ncbi:MAG: hypothetical protein U0R66_04760 [Mycobacterium sp.]
MQPHSTNHAEETDPPTGIGIHSDPTQYANYAGGSGEMYCENAVMHDGTAFVFNADVETDELGHKWPATIALAGAGLAAAVLLAVLTLGMVRSTEPVEATPPTPIIHSVTTVPADREPVDRGSARPQSTETIIISPTSQRPETATVGPEPHRPATITVTTSEPPPATMTNPLEPPPATMTNPLEPPPATMTNPLEPPPATMTNPLEPPPATMTNPLEPPVGAPGESAE